MFGHAKGRHWYYTIHPDGWANSCPNEIVLNKLKFVLTRKRSNCEIYLSAADYSNLSKTCRAANKTISGRFKSIS